VRRVTSSEVWDEKTAAHYDQECAERYDPAVLGPTVAFLGELAGSGAALEFAIGTGRVALPLAELGVAVSGVELSEAMLAELRRKPGGERIPVTVGDMAGATVAGQFSVVFLVFNSITNLRTQQEQVECFRNAARHLVPGGRFVIELLVPPLRRMPPGMLAVPGRVTDGHLIFDTFDLVAQACTSHHYMTRPDGSVYYGAGSFRYIWPAECDLMAQLAGLEFEDRFADWDRSPFTSDSEGHVSVWRKPAALEG
jgi:SAM-dependent methyltransferase